MIRERDITGFFHAKSSLVALLVLMCFCCKLAWERGAVVPVTGNLGFGLPSANNWIDFGSVSALVNLGVITAVAFLAVNINRTFNILRSLTTLVATMFVAMELALPSLLGQFFGGSLLVLLVMFCSMLLFSVYSEPRGERRIFLIFCILSGAAFTQIAFAFYLPLIFLGMAQMRVLTFRGIIAALLGIITPAWILFGFGVVSPDSLRWPGLVLVWSLFDTADMVQAGVVTGFTILLGIVFTVANILKILSYNSRIRAFNGFLTLMFVYTAILMVVNFNNFTFYVPLLNCMVAYQVGHFFTYRRQKRSYIPIALLMLVYVGFYGWAISL